MQINSLISTESVSESQILSPTNLDKHQQQIGNVNNPVKKERKRRRKDLETENDNQAKPRQRRCYVKKKYQLLV